MVSPLRDPKLEYAYQRLTDKWNEERKVRQFVIHFCMAQTPLYTSEGIPNGKCKDLCRWTNQDKLWFVTQEVVEYYSDKSFSWMESLLVSLEHINKQTFRRIHNSTCTSSSLNREICWCWQWAYFEQSEIQPLST